jgi:hypothetical protein
MIGGARTKVNHGAAFFPAASASLLAILTRVVCHVPSLLARDASMFLWTETETETVLASQATQDLL